MDQSSLITIRYRYTHLHTKDNDSNFLLPPWDNLDKYSFWWKLNLLPLTFPVILPLPGSKILACLFELPWPNLSWEQQAGLFVYLFVCLVSHWFPVVLKENAGFAVGGRWVRQLISSSAKAIGLKLHRIYVVRNQVYTAHL